MTDDIPDGVLAPDELEPDDDRVRRLEDGRYVVATDPAESLASETGGGTGSDLNTEPTPEPEPEANGGSQEAQDLNGAYGLEIRARAGDGSAESYRFETDDVSAAFEGLVRWYTDRVAGDTPTEEALAVLFENTDVELPGGE